MKYITKTYISLSIVLIVSFVAALVLPMDNIFRGIAATPAVGALFIALYQIFRDQAAYEKELELQRQQQFFNLGVTSHMANVAFDKHVAFCEKYIAKVHHILLTLVREGPTEIGRDLARNLDTIRIEYDTWITEDITNSLRRFEDAVFSIGTKTHLSNVGKPDAAQKAQEEADALWGEILGDLFDKTKTPDENIAVESVKKKIRDILEIEKLTQLRGALINKAIESMEKNT